MSRIGTSELLTNFHEHYAELMAFLARRLGNVEQAADVAQDTYLRLVNLLRANRSRSRARSCSASPAT